MDDDLLGGLDGAGALRSGGVLARQCGAGLSGCALAGLALAAAIPVLWAGWWLWAEKAPPLPEEELMGQQGKVHIVTDEVFL